MLQIQRFLQNKQYHPLNLITISRKNLRANYAYLSSLHPKIKVSPVLKSNAYGHGLVLTAKILDDIGAPFFCVDSLYEAYELLKEKIKIPILIMGYIDPRSLEVKKLPFIFAAYEKTLFETLSKFQPDAKVHIFIDTGMHREGITIDKLPDVLMAIKAYPNVKVEGFMSHFAIGYDLKNALTQEQIQTFQKAQKILQSFEITPKWQHISASDAFLKLPHMGNMARVGLALYGISQDKKLIPVLRFTTRIMQIKQLKKGESVGYDATFLAKKDMMIAVLPVGYHDGVDRRLSNKGIMLIDNKKCNIIGRVSMNITTIDITGIKNPQVGQEVIVYSDNPKDSNSIKNAAKLCRTIPYELLIHLAPATRRIVI